MNLLLGGDHIIAVQHVDTEFRQSVNGPIADIW